MLLYFTIEEIKSLRDYDEDDIAIKTTLEIMESQKLIAIGIEDFYPIARHLYTVYRAQDRDN